MVITAYCAPPGKGKTLCMAYSSLVFKSQGYKIFSNFDIYYPGTKTLLCDRLESMNDLGNAKKGRLEIDEIAAWLDSRESMSEGNKFVNTVLQKNRKRELSLEWSAQDFWMADIRLRLNTDYVVIPEIYYLINGKEIRVKQTYFTPINMNLLLPFAYCTARMFSGWKYQNDTGLTQKDVIEEFSFKVSPITDCYDTTEEIKELIETEVKKGIEKEKEAFKFLCGLHPMGSWVLNPYSGDKMPYSFDIEGVINEKLCIIDITTLQENKDGNTYIKLSGKDMSKYKRIEELRDAKTFFMFRKNEEWYLLPASYIWDVKKVTVPTSRIMQYCEKIS